MPKSSPPGAPLIDTNVFLRHVLDDALNHSERAHQLFGDIERGRLTCWTTPTVIFECVFTLQTHYGAPREQIRDALLPLILIEHLVVDDREHLAAIFDLYLAQRRLSFADCYHAVLAREIGSGVILSFDRGFDRIPGLTRLEPALPA